MATHRTANIPFNRIVKIGIWSNEAAKTTLANVYKQLQGLYPNKEIYISNAGFFSMCSTIPACFGLKADNKVYSDNWNMAYMGMKGKTITFCPAGTNVSNFTDAVSGYPVLIENGKKSPNFSHCIDNTDRGRTMLGYTKDSVILSCIGDTAGTSDFTLDEELSYMLKLNCTYAVNLDGGGSTQCNFNGATITSARKVSNFIYIIAEPEKAISNTTTVTTSYSIGSIIKLKAGATYTTGKVIPNWVHNSTLYCRAINKNGTVTFSILKSGAVTGTTNACNVIGTDVVSVDTQTNNTTVKPDLTIGCTVKLKKGAKYSNGKTIPNWVFNSTLYCRAINNNGTVTFSTLKVGAITGTVNKEYIEVV